MKLTVPLGRLRLNNPIVCASGTFGFGDELTGLANYSAIGAVIAKTITLHARQGNPPPRIYETSRGVINAIGLANPGLEAFMKEGLPSLAKLPCKRIVSVGGFSTQEYKTCLKELDRQKGFDAFEINLSCPNVRLKKLVSQDPQATYTITKVLRKLTKRPLFIKITPESNDIAQIARAAEKGGADAVSLVNTYFSMAINIQTKRPYLGNVYGGYSGPAIKPMSVYRVWRAAQAVRIPVIGGGGIEIAEDAIEFLLAGASAVSLGTVNLIYPNIAQTILKGMKGYMRTTKTKDIKKIIGDLRRV